MQVFASASAWIFHGVNDNGFKIIPEPIAWLLRGLDDGVPYGGPIVLTANLTMTLAMVAEVRGIFSTRPYDDEMRQALKAACYELGATQVHGLDKEPHGILSTTVTVGQDKVADVRAILTTETYDAEMSCAIKMACADIGAKQVRMVRFKDGVEQPAVLLSVRPRCP